MTFTIFIHWIVLISLVYLGITSLIFIRNRFEFTAIADEKNSKGRDRDQIPKISVCIPARNEEYNIGNLLKSLSIQEYKFYEVLVLDDQSEDQTAKVVKEYTQRDPEIFKLFHGKEKPMDWLGKPWACQQLAGHATGEILLFLDADTVMENHTLSAVSSAFENHRIQMLTVWPQQKLITFWEKVIIPLVYYALLTMLPSIYVYRKPRWMPLLFYRFFKTAFAASNGQCIAILRDPYFEIKGHESVKNRIVEDVELAKAVKMHNYKLRMFHGVDSLYCRMYKSEQEIYEGFRKNFLTGFNDSVLLFTAFAVLHLIVFISPFIGLIYALFTGNPMILFLSSASIALMLMHRLILSVWFKWDPIYSFTHPVGVLWFQRLGMQCLFDRFSGKKRSWKGRSV